MTLLQVKKDCNYKTDKNIVGMGLELYPGEYFKFENLENDCVRISNARTNAILSVDYINNFMEVVDMDINIVNSGVKVLGKVIKKFLRANFDVNYIVMSEGKFRTKYVKDDATYLIVSEPLVGLVIKEETEVSLEKENNAFKNINNDEIKRAFDWTSDKINKIRTNEIKTGLKLDVLLNTCIDIFNQTEKICEDATKRAMEQFKDKRDLNDTIEKVNEKINDTVNSVINKANQFSNDLRDESLDIDEIRALKGQPVWYEVVKDIADIADAGTTGWGLVVADTVFELDDILLKTEGGNIPLPELMSYVKVYKNKFEKTVQEIRNNSEESPIKKQVDFCKDKLNNLKTELQSENGINIKKMFEKEIPITDEEDKVEENPIDLDAITELNEKMGVSLALAKEALDYAKNDKRIAIAYIKAKTYLNNETNLTLEEKVNLFLED